MIRNRNGYWMSTKFLLDPDEGGAAGGAGGGTGAPAGGDNPGGESDNPSGNEPEGGKQGGQDEQNGNDSVEALNAEIARLKAQAAKQKEDLDKACKEAGEARKALKAKMTAEEIAAKEKEEAEVAQKNRIIELEKQVAKTNTVKSVMGKLGLDEDSAGNLADALYGASDIENALLEIQKAWQAKEAALRKEYGKITGPGAGADSNSPEAQAIRRATEIGKARNAQNEQAQKALGAYMR